MRVFKVNVIIKKEYEYNLNNCIAFKSKTPLYA